MMSEQVKGKNAPTSSATFLDAFHAMQSYCFCCPDQTQSIPELIKESIVKNIGFISHSLEEGCHDKIQYDNGLPNEEIKELNNVMPLSKPIMGMDASAFNQFFSGAPEQDCPVDSKVNFLTLGTISIHSIKCICCLYPYNLTFKRSYLI